LLSDTIFKSMANRIIRFFEFIRELLGRLRPKLWLRKVRKANIPAAERDICERYGENAIAQTLASGHAPRSKDLQVIYGTDETVQHARDWLTECSDSRVRHEQWRTIQEFVVIGLEILVIALISWEIRISIREEREEVQAFGKEQEIWTNLEASSRATASTLTALQQTTEQLNNAMQEQLGLAYEVALSVQLDAFGGRLEITNEGHTRVTLWGAKIADQVTVMQTRPIILAPGAPQSIPGEPIMALAQQQMGQKQVAAVPVTLFLKNEKEQEFVARYVLRGGPLYRAFSLHTEVISVTPLTWSKKTKVGPR
jgi:hypothetical protein